MLQQSLDNGEGCKPHFEKPATSLISQELLEREKASRQKNQELKLQVKHVLKQVDDVVKEGRNTLERPMTSLSMMAQKEEQTDKRSTTLRTPKIRRPVSASAVDTTEKPKPQISDARQAPSKMSGIYAQSGSILENDTMGCSGAIPGLPRNTHEEDLGAEATNRFLKAKLHVLQKELETIVLDHSEKESQHIIVLEKLRQLEEDASKTQKAMVKSQSVSEKLRVELHEVKCHHEAALVDLARSKKDMNEAAKQTRQIEAEAKTRDLKLNRALEELEKCRSLLAKKEDDAKDKIDITKRTAESLFADNKKLQKQKTELLAAFKKQAQLITILKRQKMHLEAVKLLHFTEEEFVRALNWDV
ncbi:hypothetical protein BASA50_002904 [Batrachochytrium salamandrivorans]|uniref:Testis expressed 9 n=1 Tax=Batrachochytrium salamandrivorans TaxID=1357716 RepID=A0ABQ8FMX8_9FUNG|nr:hypothetical protein BASA50_002904 [Batrachochytrium salamandrivorans]KAH9254354.1 hypothetical protein BASA81_007636 [Batrachochytrium salamandrivorans]KAH9267966.1 hypothetical protein BASA84_000431 [Batrachochytrium salamandrivorans]